MDMRWHTNEIICQKRGAHVLHALILVDNCMRDLKMHTCKRHKFHLVGAARRGGPAVFQSSKLHRSRFALYWRVARRRVRHAIFGRIVGLTLAFLWVALPSIWLSNASWHKHFLAKHTCVWLYANALRSNEMCERFLFLVQQKSFSHVFGFF